MVRTDAGLSRWPSGYFKLRESEFTGRVIEALSSDPHLMRRSGQIVVATELAQELCVVDIDTQFR